MLCVALSVCLSVYLPVCLSCLSVCVCLCVCVQAGSLNASANVTGPDGSQQSFAVAASQCPLSSSSGVAAAHPTSTPGVGAGSPVSVPSSCVLRVGGFNTDSSVLLPFSPAAGENFPTAFRATANSTVVRTCVDTTTARLTHRT